MPTARRHHGSRASSPEPQLKLGSDCPHAVKHVVVGVAVDPFGDCILHDPGEIVRGDGLGLARLALEGALGDCLCRGGGPDGRPRSKGEPLWLFLAIGFIVLGYQINKLIAAAGTWETTCGIWCRPAQLR